MLALEAAVAAIGYVALACLLGQLVAAGFIMSDGEPNDLRRLLITWALAALLVFVGFSVLALLIQGAKLQRGIPSAELLWRYLTMTQSGHVWLARGAYALVLVLNHVVVAAVRSKRARSALARDSHPPAGGEPQSDESRGRSAGQHCDHRNRRRCSFNRYNRLGRRAHRPLANAFSRQESMESTDLMDGSMRRTLFPARSG